MGISLDSIGGAIDSATTSVGNAISSATSGVTNFLSSGPASALSSIGNAVTGALSSLGTLIKPLSGVQLPLPNPLFAYASYDYVLGIAVLSDNQLNNPDKGYMNSSVKLDLICKSANSDPTNRIQTTFGQFDYFIDKLEIDSTIGLEKGNNTNMHTMSFEITEPYSMGTFMMTIQEAAWKSDHDNYLQAPFLLTIDFRGNTETGQILSVPNTSRKIPFKFKDITMTVTEAGAVYKCTATPWNSQAQSSHVSAIKNDHSVTGTTVQEVLQTGEKSLQAALNKRLQQLKTDKIVNVPDQILILFPTDVSSGGVNSSGGDKEDSTGSVTSVSADSADAIAKSLGLSQSTIPANNTLVQDPANVNDIGKSKMGFSDTRKGDAPVGKDNVVHDANGNTIRSNNTIDTKQSDMRFSQDTDITAAIDAVILNSDYATDQLQEHNIDKAGMRKWWRVDTQVYTISTKENLGQTGTKPRIIVYRIVPFGVHTSKTTTVGKKAPGFDELEKQCVKVYDYLYTGKNVDVLNFHIEFKAGFTGKMGATSFKKTIDNKQQAAASGAESGDKTNLNPLPTGQAPERKLGVIPQAVNFTGTSTSSDGQGGGGIEDEKTRAARQFHEAITSAAGMLQLDLKIIGDPYFIAQSGMGNYTSAPTQYQNLNSDGTVNYQGSEVDIKINFRTPIDINQTTGLYDFGKSSKSAPVLTWSGIYQVTKVVSHFDNGQFTQVLSGPRRNGQEITGAGSSSATMNTSNEKKDPTPVNKDPTE